MPVLAASKPAAELRRRWRAPALVIKAKLEAVESGIRTFDEEFVADTVLPDGRTVAQWLLPQVDAAAVSGFMSALLPMFENSEAVKR